MHPKPLLRNNLPPDNPPCFMHDNALVCRCETHIKVPPRTWLLAGHSCYTVEAAASTPVNPRPNPVPSHHQMTLVHCECLVVSESICALADTHVMDETDHLARAPQSLPGVFEVRLCIPRCDMMRMCFGAAKPICTWNSTQATLTLASANLSVAITVVWYFVRGRCQAQALCDPTFARTPGGFRSTMENACRKFLQYVWHAFASKSLRGLRHGPYRPAEAAGPFPPGLPPPVTPMPHGTCASSPMHLKG